MSHKLESLDETYYKELILSLFQKLKKPLLLREIYHLLRIPPSSKSWIRKLIHQLVEEGKLEILKKRKFFIPQRDLIYKGKLRVHPGKFGFVETEEGKSIFIPPRKMKQALDGDIVLVRVDKTTSKKPEGTIIRVLERKRKNIIGYLVKRKGLFFVEPEDPKFPFEIYIPKKRRHKAEVGHLVVTKIIEPTSEFGLPIGEVVRELGDPNLLETHSLAVIYRLDLPYEFSPKVEKELARFP
ncbi:MAG: ribonuclease R, partial [Thermodesulfobacteriaceae bacterium]|nr:ribonuclease R [Thermodesulfobacteriaceae bacterium]